MRTKNFPFIVGLPVLGVALIAAYGFLVHQRSMGGEVTRGGDQVRECEKKRIRLTNTPKLGPVELVGRFHVIYGRPPRGSQIKSVPNTYILSEVNDRGEVVNLVLAATTRFVGGRGVGDYVNRKVKVVGRFDPRTCALTLESIVLRV